MTLTGSNLESVSGAEIGGLSLEIVSVSGGFIKLQIPDSVTTGLKDLVLKSSSGQLTIQGALKVIEANTAYTSAAPFSIKQTGGKVRLAANNAVGVGKVQFKINGREYGWIRAIDIRDPKLREADGNHYFVRTLNLRIGKNNVEIWVDGECVERADIRRN